MIYRRRVEDMNFRRAQCARLFLPVGRRTLADGLTEQGICHGLTARRGDRHKGHHITVRSAMQERGRVNKVQHSVRTCGDGATTATLPRLTPRGTL